MPSAFDIETAFTRLQDVMKRYPRAAMFQLAEDGYTSVFEQLIACIISIRTYDEVSLPVSRQLFETANTPQAMSQLSVEEIERLIARSTYAERKAGQILAIAQDIVCNYNGELPCEEDVLLSFKGVGPKCAHLALGIACQQPYISVDVHVHRVMNRWGYVETKTPEKTTRALAVKLPKAYWIDTNRLLMPFGKHICKGRFPSCDRCPLADICPRLTL
ncbi:MAG: endonuclease III [Cyanobacteria bacterium J06649_5]